MTGIRSAEEKVNPLASRRMIHGEAMTVIRLHFLKGAMTKVHLHKEEQIRMAERGAVRFLAGGAEHVVSANEALVIPSNVPHELEALEDSFVADVFATPPSCAYPNQAPEPARPVSPPI